MTNTMNTPPCIYRSGCQRRDCVDQCLGLHSNREKQATQAPSKELLVFKATPKHYPDSPCHFGDYTTARAWAGDGGTIETVTLRPQPKLVQSDHEPLSGEALLKNLEGQCQALWRTNFTLVCTLPRGHDGDHRADCGYTFNGEVDVRPSPPPFDDPFQDRVAKWMVATFDAETVANKDERNHRFLEESLELVQSLGCTQAEAHMLVDYVFGRAVGECEQETGGVMVTLAALANASNIHVNRVAETELARCWTKIDVIRAKQAGKPKHSPLPGPTPTKGADAP